MEWKTANPDRYELLKTFAKENRQFMTEAERALWMRLRGNALGHKFLRQHIIGDYIVDFLCRDAQVVIEVDGGYHKERQFLYKYPHSYFLMPNKSLPTQGGLVGPYPFILLYNSKNISAGYWVKNGRLRFIQYR